MEDSGRSAGGSNLAGGVRSRSRAGEDPRERLDQDRRLDFERRDWEESWGRSERAQQPELDQTGAERRSEGGPEG